MMKVNYAHVFIATMVLSAVRLFDYLIWKAVLSLGLPEITASEFTTIALYINSLVMIVIQICAGIHIAIKSMQVKKEINALLERLGRQ